MIRDGLRVLLARDRAVEGWLQGQVGPAYDALKDDPNQNLWVQSSSRATVDGGDLVDAGPRADLEAAAEGVMRSAFGLQNQKCSATSRVYVQRDV